MAEERVSGDGKDAVRRDVFGWGLFFGFVGDGDAAEATGRVDVDGVAAFFGDVFAVVGEATKDEAGFEFDYDVVRDDDVDTAEESEGFDDGVFGEFGFA